MITRVAVPAGSRALTTLARVDYADAFRVGLEPAAPDRSAEEWARSMLEGAPRPVGDGLRSGWRALGLHLGPRRSPRHVLGWRMHTSTPSMLLLGADSRIGMPAQLLFRLDDGALLFSTFVAHESAAARTMWACVEPMHRPIVRSLLWRATRSPAAGRRDVDR